MAQKTKKSFVFNIAWQEVLMGYPSEVRLEVYDAIIEYVASGTISELKPLAKMAFSFIKKEVDKNKLKEPPSGENHWNWKGGITDDNHKQRESSEYKHWRKNVFRRDNYTCRHCGKYGGKLNAHHVKPFSTYPDLRFNVNNGVTLCRECHIQLHKLERGWIKYYEK
ncbi:DUF6291 domain-containing protein [Paraprevotella clara]|uniref:HNH endonuclease domain protein n=1 Tax=Paraprevotella clara YIT 11840 TaxID=762968 RepID=G5SMF8_9BACT|nr:DUF6291 domain-containing protein [Paraprevotella clara]EHH01510.1 HNH endonuclease domain protein [Paraprevotella clara YIT 11840]